MPTPETGAAEPPAKPERLADAGPRYLETPADPYAPDAPVIAEPWNAVTASFFIVIVLAWAVRLRGRYRRFPFLVCCMPILLAGGIGGTLYHAYRTRLAYFLLDVIPIQILGLASSLYLAIRLGRTFGTKRVLLISGAILAAFAFVNWTLTLVPSDIPTLRICLNYGSLATIILIPVVITLVRSRFAHAGFVWAGLGSFAIALFFRFVDPYSPLPMGTHWLWHTFGALCTAFVIEYFYRVERGSAVPLPSAAPIDHTGAAGIPRLPSLPEDRP